MVNDAHPLKYEDSLLYKSPKDFDTNHRLLITGTPLQNNLKELWVLLFFIMPDKYAFFLPSHFWVIDYFNDFCFVFIVCSFDSCDSFEQEPRQCGAERLLASSQAAKALYPPASHEGRRKIPAGQGIWECFNFGSSFRWQLKLASLCSGRIHLASGHDYKYDGQYYKWILTKNYAALRKGNKRSAATFVKVVMELKKYCNQAFLTKTQENEQRYGTTKQLEQLIRGSGKLVLPDKLLVRLQRRAIVYSSSP